MLKSFGSAVPLQAAAAALASLLFSLKDLRMSRVLSICPCRPPSVHHLQSPNPYLRPECGGVACGSSAEGLHTRAGAWLDYPHYCYELEMPHNSMLPTSPIAFIKQTHQQWRRSAQLILPVNMMCINAVQLCTCHRSLHALSNLLPVC